MSGWDEKPSNPAEDIQAVARELFPKFESGDRAWLVVETKADGWLVLLPAVFVVSAGLGARSFWVYAGGSKMTIGPDGRVVDGGPVLAEVDAEYLGNTYVEAVEIAKRLNGKKGS